MIYRHLNGRDLLSELQNLQQFMDQPTFAGIYLDQLNAAPGRPVDGMLAYADGTNWNPGGTGQGIYAYYAGAWNRLG